MKQTRNTRCFRWSRVTLGSSRSFHRSVVLKRLLGLLIWTCWDQAELRWINGVLCWLHVSLRFNCRAAVVRLFTRGPLSWGLFPLKSYDNGVIARQNSLLTAPLAASDSGRGRRQPVRVGQLHAAPDDHQSGKPLLIGRDHRRGAAHGPQQLLRHAGREWVWNTGSQKRRECVNYWRFRVDCTNIYFIGSFVFFVLFLKYFSLKHFM